jgi:hypothetical protein
MDRWAQVIANPPREAATVNGDALEGVERVGPRNLKDTVSVSAISFSYLIEIERLI